MITNSTLIRLDVAGIRNAVGVVPFTSGAVVAVAGNLGDVQTSQKWVLEGKIKDATGIWEADLGELTAAGLPAEGIKTGDRLQLVENEVPDTTLTRYVVYVKINRKGGGLSYAQIFTTEKVPGGAAGSGGGVG